MLDRLVRRLRHPWTPGIRRRPLGTLDFVVVDVETTGWSPDAAGITEIGAVRLSGGQVQGEFAALVNPGRLIPPDIVALTGITEAMVAHAPPVTAVLPGFLDFARGAVLTAHNAPFDVGFLTAACAASGRRWPAPPVLDTVTLARLLLTADEVPNCKLATLADFFGAPTLPRHRALADARATAAVLAALLDRLPATGVRTLAQLSAAERAAARQAGPPARPRRRGRSAGQPVSSGTLRGAGGPAEGRPPDGQAQALRRRQVITAIVLLKADVARIPETAEIIAQIPQVSEVYSVTGEFDLVALVRVRAHEELADVIPGTLNRVDGVTHTETHIAFRTYSRHDLEAAFALGYEED